MGDLAAWLPAAQRAGLTVAEIARLSGVTRRTLYAIMGRAAQGETPPA